MSAATMRRTKIIMSNPFKKTFQEHIPALLAGMALAFASGAASAATTNTFNFNNTIVAGGSGSANPANGVVSISGTNLVAGEVLVFDGIVIDVPGSSADAWGAIELNSGGYLGLTGATLGVLAETGTASGNQWQLFVNGSGSSTMFGPAALDARTNRVHIELDCTETGSTTNMTYWVEIDQGLTGTYNDSLSGTGLNFANNTIALAFGANNESHEFIQTQPILAVSAPAPATNLVALGLTATFAATITQGFPLDTVQQWRSNGVPIAGATALSYTTPPTTAAFNGAQYTIVVTNLLTPGNIVTSSAAVLEVRSTPGIVTFNFPATSVAAGGGSVTDPGVSLSGNGLLAGDTVVFDGIVTPNGSQLSDAWTAINIDGGNYGNVVGAKLGVLTRMGSGANPSQLFINAATVTNPTPGSAPTNRVRIELYPSVTGSTTNMGWLVKIDQNLTGKFLPAVTGTNLTFPNNTLPLTFGSSGSASYVYQNPQSPVSIFGGPSPTAQVVAVGAPISVGVTVEGWDPAFQWRKNGVAIPGATNEDYSSPPATLGDNGDQLTVVVSNRLSSLNVVTSSVATVAVLIPNNLTWYPQGDFTTWDTVTRNWTTNGGGSQVAFATGNNVTFDDLGFNIGGNTVTVTNGVNPNAVTVNASSFDGYVFTGPGSVSGQNLVVSGDGTGQLYLQTTNGTAFNSVTITNFAGAASTNTVLQVGYNGVDGELTAYGIANYGTLDFDDAGLAAVSGIITGSGQVIQDGSGTTVLSATNSSYTIGAINNGTLSIATTPKPGPFVNNGVLVPASAASVIAVPNAISGSGLFDFTGFQTTIVTGVSSFTGRNLIFWGDVIVDNPAALGDPNAGSTDVSGADRFGGLYLSNSIVWTQPLEIDTRYTTGQAAAAAEIANWNGTNDIVGPLAFETGSAAGANGTELNVEVTRGQLTIDAASVLANGTYYGPVDLNLQGAGTGFWNAPLADGTTPLNVVMRGTGTWTLGGANSYSGVTTVASGTLLITNQIAGGNVTVQSGGALGGDGIIGGTVTIAAGGTLTLMPGQGTSSLTIDNGLTLSPGSFTSLQINKTAGTNDVITGLTSLVYGGTLVITNLSGALTTSDAFPLFAATASSGAFATILPATPGAGLAWNTNTLTTDGTLRIAVQTGPASNPTNLTARVSGGILSLSWPADHTGWRLLVQTNGLVTGLNINSNAWTTVPGSTSTDQVDIPVNPQVSTAFYRLVYP
jgi:autotransporter-associated beta strand protein